MTQEPSSDEPKQQRNELISSVPKEDRVLGAFKYGVGTAVVVKVIGEILLLLEGRFEQAYLAGRASTGWEMKKLHLIAMIEHPWMTPLVIGLLVAIVTYLDSHPKGFQPPQE